MTEISTRQRVAVACAMLATALSATAQAQPPTPAASAVQAAPGQRGDPTDARSDVPLLVYRSPLQGYRPYADTEPASWVETNKTVATDGGYMPRKLANRMRPTLPARQRPVPSPMPNRTQASRSQQAMQATR